MDKTKNTTILGIAIAAIIISLITITMPLFSASQTDNQHYSGQTREFWLFNSNIPDFNETKMAMPHDVYSMPAISVLKSDTVLIHFFNTEEVGGDHHSFTIKDLPYNINVELSPGQNKTITFNANTTVLYIYNCTFHKPTKRAQLIVSTPPY